MNKRIIIAQVAAIYIAMIGSVSAAPPLIEPIAVETVEGNPLDVHVTDKSEIRIPSTGVAECLLEPGSSRCEVDILAPESFPDGTNTFVIQQISVHQSSNVSEHFDFFLKTFHQGASYMFRPPIAPGLAFNGVFDRNHNERVSIYHDAVLSTVPIRSAEVTFRKASGNIGTGPLKQTMHYSGYYTFFDQPQP